MQFVPEPIHDYCVSHSRNPSDLCEELAVFTQENVPYPQMLSGPLVGSLLGFLLSSSGAKRVLEVGTYTGYSALAMAERLPDGGELLTLDLNPETQAIAKKFWARSPAGSRIRALCGKASELLAKEKGPFDFVFIDADKAGYLGYLEAVLPKLSERGVVVADNTLWSGRVLEDASKADADTKAIQKFNDWVHANPKLESVLLPVRDGLHLIRKR